MGKTKQTGVTFGGMNQDISIQKFPPNLYYEARNMKLNPVEGQASGAISNSYGNKLVLTLPEVFIDSGAGTISYGDKVINYVNEEISELASASGRHRIIGSEPTRAGVILFTTTDNKVDCVWEVLDLDSDPLEYKLLYVRNMDFSVNNPIQAVFNYENSLLQKVYWVDGNNFLRFFNKEQSIANGFDSDLMENNLASINSRGEFTLRKPTIERSAGGGVHTAGMIQYGYTQYNVNGSETILSPLSDLFPLDKGEDRGGGNLNEDVGAMPVVIIEDLDTDFDYLRLYSIKYTTYNSTPEVKMIYDGSIGNHIRFSFNDTGATNLGTLSLEELAFLGADPIVPKHIASKDSILFAANNKLSTYDFEIDTRAYSFDEAGFKAQIFDNVVYEDDGSDIPYTGDLLEVKSDYDIVPEDFDAVNLDFDTYRWKKDGTTSAADVLVQQAAYAYNWNHPGGIPATNNIQMIMVPQYGEASIVGGTFTSTFAGTATLDLNSVINRNNSTIGEDQNNFFLEVRKNGLVHSVFNPILNQPTYNYDSFSTSIVLEVGDKVEVILKYQYMWHEFGQSGPSFNIDFTGEVTITKEVAAGNNGEGGTGKYVEYELTRTPINLVNNTLDRFFKDNEIYRISIHFGNKRGQLTPASWIADFKAPQGNLEGQLNTLKVNLTPEFYNYIATLPEEERPVSYAILRARRSDTDKTIIAQGMLTGMFVQSFTEDYQDLDNISKRVEFNKDLTKLPIPMTRGYGTSVAKAQSYYPLYSTQHGESMNEYSRDRTGSDLRKEKWDNPNGYTFREVFTAQREVYKYQQTWQYTKLFQLQAPELLFNKNVVTSDYDELRVLGTVKRRDCTIWDKPYDLDKFIDHNERGSKNDFINGAPAEFDLDTTTKTGYGVIGPSYRDWSSGGADDYNMMRRIHVYKNFDTLIRSQSVYEIYGEPEISSIGHSGKYYNGDRSLKYMNKLTTMVSDRARDENENHDSGSLRKIVSVVSEGSRSMTIALGDYSLDAESRPGLEDLYANTGANDWDVELIAEVIKPKSFVYSGAIYNGYTNEAKERTEYIQIGDTMDINESEVEILSPGDTFVQQFTCTRLAKTPGNSYDIKTESFVETVEYLTETSINLKERSDKSWLGWDNSIEPTFEEAAVYNDVYSTDIQAITYTGEDARLKKIEQKEVEIIASKVKIPGEFIENWVDFKPNEVQNLDGKFGPINNLSLLKDEMVAFQDTAVAHIAINPRVQVQGQDNVNIELGTGNVLHDYSYISTTSGSTNKWSVLTTPGGIFYTDILNKGIKKIDGQEREVSDSLGMHSTLVNLLERDELREDNPLTGKGIAMGNSLTDGDVFTSLHQENEDTLSYNYKMNRFTSFYDFVPTRYINKGDKLFTVPLITDVDKVPDNTLWLHGQDNYQTFYNTKYESYVTMLINGENSMEKIFNSIEFNSEVTLDKDDISNVTVDSIEAWNTYQKSGKVSLTIPNNLKRRFRTWRANIPREDNARNRMNDKVLYLKLSFNPEEDYKLILHDITVKYI